MLINIANKQAINKVYAHTKTFVLNGIIFNFQITL